MLQTHRHFPKMFPLPYVRELILRSSNECNLVCAGFGFHIPYECEIDQIEDTWEVMNSKHSITGAMKRLLKWLFTSIKVPSAVSSLQEERSGGQVVSDSQLS